MDVLSIYALYRNPISFLRSHPAIPNKYRKKSSRKECPSQKLKYSRGKLLGNCHGSCDLWVFSKLKVGKKYKPLDKQGTSSPTLCKSQRDSSIFSYGDQHSY